MMDLARQQKTPAAGSPCSELPRTVSVSFRLADPFLCPLGFVWVPLWVSAYEDKSFIHCWSPVVQESVNMHWMNKPIQAWCAWKCVSFVSEEASVEDAKTTNILVKQGWATGSIESVAVRKQNPWALTSEYAGGNFVSILTWMISSLNTEPVISAYKDQHDCLRNS